MGETAGPPSYEELLHTFKAVLNHALCQGELLPTCLSFDLAVVQAIGDVARAAGDGSPTRELVDVACKAFATYAVEQEIPGRTRSSATVKIDERLAHRGRAGGKAVVDT